NGFEERAQATLTERTTAPVVPSARPGADIPLRSPTGIPAVGVPRLDVGQPTGMPRPGANDSMPAVPRSGAMDATPTAAPSRTTREQAMPSRAWPSAPSPPDDRARPTQDQTAPSQDRTPSWQSRPGEPRPAPTVARPGVWSDPSPSRGQRRPPSDSP